MSRIKIFITGGAGFVGSHLARRLLAQGHGVTVYDNFLTGRRENLEKSLNDPKLTVVNGDLLDLKTVVKSMAGHEMVYHFAANADIRAGIEKTDIDLKLNLMTTYNVLEAMRLNGIKKILFSSSSAVYGDPEEVPTKETELTRPIALYGAGKAGAEAYISAYCSTFGMQAWIMRMVNTIGTYNTHGVIGDFIRKLTDNPKKLLILGNGKQSKAYVHVDDCLDAYEVALKKANGTVNVFNVGAEDWADVDAVAGIVTEEMGLKDVKYEYTGGASGWVGDVPKVMLSIEKIKALGWKPKYTSEEAVRKATKEMLRLPIPDKYRRKA